MATANVTGLERTASLALSARSVHGPDRSDDTKRAAVTEMAEKDGSVSRLSKDEESIDSQQPAGLKQMQAITLTWSKKWLITSYAL